MQLIRLQYPFQKTDYPAQVLAIGDFDGVHLGHRKVIGQAVNTAREAGVASAIMTFDPHPREVLGQQKYECLLTPFPHKLQLLAGLDVDYLYVVSFDETFAAISPEQFINEILYSMNLHTVVIGFDFTFGHRGKGNAELLRNAKSLSFSVQVVEPHLFATEKVSSTRIRQLLAEGDVASIPALLGRHYDLIGVVRHGDGRGRKIGFPTANLELDGSYIFPKLGVYAVYASVNGSRYPAVVNIGVRPTFLVEPVVANVEVHLLDFDGDLYNDTMSIELVQFLRTEQKFNGVDQLIAQIHRDIEQTRQIFSVES